VVYRIVSHHIALRDYPVALSWLQRMVVRDLRNPTLLSKTGYVLLQMGDIEGARLGVPACRGHCEESGRGQKGGGRGKQWGGG